MIAQRIAALQRNITENSRALAATKCPLRCYKLQAAISRQQREVRRLEILLERQPQTQQEVM